LSSGVGRLTAAVVLIIPRNSGCVVSRCGGSVGVGCVSGRRMGVAGSLVSIRGAVGSAREKM